MPFFLKKGVPKAGGGGGCVSRCKVSCLPVPRASPYAPWGESETPCIQVLTLYKVPRVETIDDAIRW